jgi:hypothetical protein
LAGALGAALNGRNVSALWNGSKVFWGFERFMYKWKGGNDEVGFEIELSSRFFMK